LTGSDGDPHDAAAARDPFGRQHHHSAPPRLGQEAFADAEDASADGGVPD